MPKSDLELPNCHERPRPALAPRTRPADGIPLHAAFASGRSPTPAPRRVPGWALATSAATLLALRIGVSERATTWALLQIFARLPFSDYLVARSCPGLRRAFVQNLLRTVRAKLARGDLRAGPVIRWVALLLVAATKSSRRAQRFHARHGFAPPAFLTVAITERCNLRCTHCYADSHNRRDRNLDFATLSRVIADQRAEWGAAMAIITGGEPFLYRDGRSDFLTLAREHPCTLFIVYCNGLLITDRVASHLAKLGNVVPLISLEGDEAQTSGVRGPRAWSGALEAMHNLRAHGVIFGVSLTAGRANAEMLAQPEFYRRLRDEYGATFFWILERAPLGRGARRLLELMPLNQKRALQAALSSLVESHGLLVVSHLHTAAAHGGCLGAGRVDGFFHIDSGGDVKHCVYSPLRLDNIHQIYAGGESLSRFLLTPRAAVIRHAQASWFANPIDREQYRPCPATSDSEACL